MPRLLGRRHRASLQRLRPLLRAVQLQLTALRLARALLTPPLQPSRLLTRPRPRRPASPRSVIAARLQALAPIPLAPIPLERRSRPPALRLVARMQTEPLVHRNVDRVPGLGSQTQRARGRQRVPIASVAVGAVEEVPVPVRVPVPTRSRRPAAQGPNRPDPAGQDSRLREPVDSLAPMMPVGARLAVTVQAESRLPEVIGAGPVRVGPVRADRPNQDPARAGLASGVSPSPWPRC